MLQHQVFKSFRRRKKKSSHGSKSLGSQEGMTDIVQMEELEEAERQAAKPAWRTRAFWQSAIPMFVSVVLLTVGTVLATKHYQRQVCCLADIGLHCMCTCSFQDAICLLAERLCLTVYASKAPVVIKHRVMPALTRVFGRVLIYVRQSTCFDPAMRQLGKQVSQTDYETACQALYEVE